MADNDLIRRGDALALPPHDSDGDPAGKWDHHVFVRRDAIAALPAVTVVPVYDIPVQSIEYCLLRMVVTTAQDADEKKALRLWIDTLRSKGDRG